MVDGDAVKQIIMDALKHCATMDLIGYEKWELARDGKYAEYLEEDYLHDMIARQKAFESVYDIAIKLSMVAKIKDFNKLFEYEASIADNDYKETALEEYGEDCADIYESEEADND